MHFAPILGNREMYIFFPTFLYFSYFGVLVFLVFNMEKSPKYIPDTPHGADFFNIHSQIAEMLFKTIKSEDLTKDSFTFGLLGSWGSGKSLTVGKLREKLKDENDVLFFEFDVWKYVDTSLYRSILIDFEKELKNKAEEGKVPESFKIGIQTSEGKDLHDLLYKSTQVTTPVVTNPNDWISRQIEKHRKTTSGKLYRYTILSLLKTIILTWNYIISRTEMFYFLLLLGVLFSSAYYYRSNIIDIFPFLGDAFLKPVFKFLSFTVLGLSAVEIIKEAYKDMFKEVLPKANNNVIITSPPTFAQDQFESIFKKIIEVISDCGKKKVVIVFDNIDRCESNLTIQILTGLKTFLDQKKCFYLIPCDDIRIKSHLVETHRSEDDYLDKIFQAYLRIPIIESEDKITFIEDCIKKADFELSTSDKNRISEILTYAYKGDTPRQIKRFFNDFISYYRLAEVIDPKKENLLKDVPYFTFMIAIKQKWPELESLILQDTNFFKESHRTTQPPVLAEDCIYFIEKCSAWINYDSDPAMFIHLKDSRNSGGKIQKILIEEDNNFVITYSLIQQINNFIRTQYFKQKYLFFQNSVNRLKEIIEKQQSELDEFLLIELFKAYIGNVVLHSQASYEGKNGSYVISHAKFISNNVELIRKIDFNNIDNVESEVCNTIRKVGFTDDVGRLYSNIVKTFSQQNLKKIFNQIANEDFKKFIPLLLLTDRTKVYDVCHPIIIENAVKQYNFLKEDKQFIDLLAHLVGLSESDGIERIIGTNLTAALPQFVNHGAAHPNDTLILNALETLGELRWNSQDKVNFDSYMNTRITILFQHGQNELGIRYCIQGLKYQATNAKNYFRHNPQINNLNTQHIFNLLIQQISNKDLQGLWRFTEIKENIFRIASTNNLFSKVLEKVDIQYLRNNIQLFAYNHVNCLRDLLSVPLEKRDQSPNENSKDEMPFEEKVIDQYLKTYPALIFDNYNLVLDLVKSPALTDLIIEKALDSFFNDYEKYKTHITDIIKNRIGENVELRSKIYSNHKLTLIEINQEDLFSTLVNKLNEQDRKDYIQRLLGKINSDLKIGINWLDMLYSISSHLTVAELLDNQRLVIELITELFEISREQTYNVVGNLLLNKLKVGSPSRNFNLNKHIEALINSANKSDDFKTELKKHLVINN